MAKILIILINGGTPLTPSAELRSGGSAKPPSDQEVSSVGRWILVVLLGLSGMSILGQYPLWGFGLIGVAGFIGWMSVQGRQAVRVERARPVAARQARQEVQSEVNSAQRDANREVRQQVERARREAQRNLAGAVQRVEREQAQRWSA